MNLQQFGATIAAATMLTGTLASCATTTEGRPITGLDKLSYWADTTTAIIPDSLITLAVDNLREVKAQWSDRYFGIGTVGYDENCVVLFGAYEKGNLMRATAYSRYDDSFQLETPDALPRIKLTQWVLQRRLECNT